MEWISADDKLPKRVEWVWAYAKSESEDALKALYSRWDGWSYECEGYDDGNILLGVTHWQPITDIRPEAPR